MEIQAGNSTWLQARTKSQGRLGWAESQENQFPLTGAQESNNPDPFPSQTTLYADSCTVGPQAGILRTPPFLPLADLDSSSSLDLKKAKLC